ncbi:MAG TPA: complex I subunit 1 family protein [Armatimonadaceae bacterium]|nr:complex I subunit 1 family protein [Armatimonadaceae bacterium]
METLFDSEIWKQIFVYSVAIPEHPDITWWAHVVRSVLRLAVGIGFVLTIVPGLIWLERRLLSWWQGRLGPNRVGWQGLAQPIADGIKLFFKEDIIPTNVDKTLYIIAPAVALAPVLYSVTVLPWNGSPDWGAVAPGLNIGILFLLAVASIEVYGIILAGWSSNNKYSLLGGLRASSQVISYELGMGLSIIAVLLMLGTLGTQSIVQGYPFDPKTGSEVYIQVGDVLRNGQGVIEAKNLTAGSAVSGYTVYKHAPTSTLLDWNFLRLFPFGLIATFVYLISMVAETNRAPFDLPEAETELVAGFHTEYSSMKFAMFFMGEYANMLIVSAIAITLFFGGWLAPLGFLSQLPEATWTVLPPFLVSTLNALIAGFWFGIKLFLLICFFILLRASLPRLRYDMLMKFGWKGMLPVALVNLALIGTSIAIQNRIDPAGTAIGAPSMAAWWSGQLIAWGIGIALALVLLAFKAAQYNARRRDASSTAIVPIRRAPVATPTAPSAATPEI